MQKAGRMLLGGTLVFAGVSHLTFARKPFRAQVPPWLPMNTDTVVLVSGLAEIALGVSLMTVSEQRRLVCCAAAGFFAAIFPGNLAQYTHHRDAFGLDTDGKRFGRLFFQPLLIGWALWSTGTTDK